MDEFTGNYMPISELNKWLEGSPLPLARKGTTPYLKRTNLPIVIISNYSLQRCFKDTTQQEAGFEALCGRLEVIHLESEIMLEAISE